MEEKRNGSDVGEKNHDTAPTYPWLFRHEDLIRALDNACSVPKEKLVNIINYTHFINGSISVYLRHPQYEEGILITAYPEPCLGEELTCRWDETYGKYNLERYRFEYLIINYKMSVIVVPAKLVVRSTEGLQVRLPENSYALSKRRVPRFNCQGVEARLIQDGFEAKGILKDFSAHAFRIRVQPEGTPSFHWFNPGVPAYVRLADNSGVYFSGNCRCLYEHQNGNMREIVFSPLQEEIKRFAPRVFRNPRRQAGSLFYAIFEHPFSKKKIQREIFDISTSGFSIYEDTDETVLIPGMIIPELILLYASVLKIFCKVQVLYRKIVDSHIRYGMVIIDMDLANYDKLIQILSLLSGKDESLGDKVDIDELWEFFFESGFIYPGKYSLINVYRGNFKKTYRKLYEDSPEIAKNFVYQKDGIIYSHISILRAYQNTWMIHHHAARQLEGMYPGLIVLRKLFFYVNDVHRLPSAHMNYLMCYYRPQHKVYDHIYTKFVKELKKPQASSFDLFSYVSIRTNEIQDELPSGWSITPASIPDAWEFERFYHNTSGGLFCNILELGKTLGPDSVEEVYKKMGFIRSIKPYSLKYKENLEALLILEESDIAINLSELLNAIKIIIMNNNVTKEILYASIKFLINSNNKRTYLPLMIYPSNWINKEGISYEKLYYLWILDMHYGNEFIDYLGRKFRLNLV